MGKPKQTLILNGVPMLQRVLEVLRVSSVGRVIVVLGANAAEVKKRVKFAGEVVVVNPRFAEGMSSSLRYGVEHAGRESDAVMIVLGDQPFVRSATIDTLVRAYEYSGARIIIPTHKGARGNPVIFDRGIIPKVALIRGDTGAKSVVQENEADVLEVEVADRGILVDIDTPSDLQIRRRRSRGQASRPLGRLFLAS